MKIEYIAGISTDRFIIRRDNGNVEEYVIGFNASWSRRAAAYAHQDVINAEKYKWSTPYQEKPFIGDLLPEGWEEAEWSGHNVFSNNEFSKTALEQLKEDIKAEMEK